MSIRYTCYDYQNTDGYTKADNLTRYWMDKYPPTGYYNFYGQRIAIARYLGAISPESPQQPFYGNVRTNPYDLTFIVAIRHVDDLPPNVMWGISDVPTGILNGKRGYLSGCAYYDVLTSIFNEIPITELKPYYDKYDN